MATRCARQGQDTTLPQEGIRFAAVQLDRRMVRHPDRRGSLVGTRACLALFLKAAFKTLHMPWDSHHEHIYKRLNWPEIDMDICQA